MTSRWQLRTTPPELSARHTADGQWTDETLASVLDRTLRASTGLTLRVWSDQRPFRGTVGRVHELARRVAAGLRAAGIGPREVGFILRQSAARAFVTADRFRSLDYLASLDAVRAEATELALVVTVGAVPREAIGFDRFTDHAPEDRLPEVDPDSPALIAYTSGTTAEPKGVIHTHRSILAEMHQLAAMQPQRDRPTLAGAPVGHFIGMTTGLLLPLMRGLPIHLADVWDPGAVLAAVLEADLTAGSGSTYFLTSLLDHPEFSPAHLERIRYVGLAGAPVPAAVADRAHTLGISIIRSYGCSEQPSITGSSHDDPAERRLYTDGAPLPGVEMRLVDPEGRDVAAGEPGEILSRGPELFAGYTDSRLTDKAFVEGGWYTTEDIGVVDEHGWLTITDRKKDIIIRGGENVSAGEIEELLARMPGVAEVAVVAAPDPRMGEHACAFVRPLPGAKAPGLGAMRKHLEEAGLSRQKWPEESREVADFTRTPSGKIKKFELRARLRSESREQS